MTKPHNFLPGDLVINGSTGILCTVKETPAERVKFGNPEYVYLDGDEGPDASHPFHNVHHTNLKPAPITVGAWVRVTDEFPKEINADCIGEVFKIERMDGEYTYHTKSGVSRMWRMKHLRANAAAYSRQLEIIENARLDAIGERDELQAQITKLADWINASQSAGAVDTAIRIMTEQRHAIYQAGRRIAKWVKDAPTGYGTDESRAWLAANAPELLPPVFKRGDLVWTGFVFGNARIITNDPMQYATVECMNDHGQIVVVPVASLRQAAETK